MKPASFLAVLLLLCAVIAVPAQAQTVINPRTVEFDPSADHSAVTTDGQQVVQRYDLQIYTVAATAPYKTGNLGKPAPQSDGKIRVDFSPLITPWPLPDGSYTARVVAVGPTGTAPSDVSNTFAFQSQSQTCSYSLGSTTQSFASGGGTNNVTVSAGIGCAWTAASGVTWAQVSPASGTGGGAVAVTVSANGSTSSRSTTLTIAGQSLTVTQAGLTCTYSISSTGQPFTEAGGTGSFTLSSPGGCTWTATSSAAWLTITSGASGGGGGTIGFTVAANTSTSARTATITAGGQTFTVSQSAAPVVCTYALSSPGQNVASGGGSGSFNVTTGNSCTWTAASSAPGWLTVSPPSGTGSLPVSFSVVANTATTTRTATLTVAGQVFTVTQDALDCSFSLTPASEEFGAAAASGSVTVSGPTACGWTATNSASWVTLGATSGKGGATVGVNVAPNPNATARSASLTIAGKPFSVTQAAGSCSYTLSPTSQQFGQNGGTGTVSVGCGSGCAWTATVSPPAAGQSVWVTLSATTTGSGAGTLTYTVAKNSYPTARSATITVNGQTHTINQAASNRPSAPKKPRVTSVVGG